MIRFSALLAALLVLGEAGAAPLMAQDPEATFRDFVLKHQRYLRDFTADDDVRGEWLDGKLVMVPASSHTVGALIVDKVKAGKGAIELQGERLTLVRVSDTDYSVAPTGERIRIRIRLNGAKPEEAFSGLADALFFPSLQQTLAAIPDRLKLVLPAPINEKCCSKPVRTQVAACDCADLSANGCTAKSTRMGMQGLLPAKVVYQVEPEFSEQARGKKFSGDVEVRLTVDEAGHPGDIWIVKSAGMGLDHAAGSAVGQYRFTPATCHGKPVPMDLNVEVNFQIF